MTKVAIKSDKITSFGGIFHVMDVFFKLAESTSKCKIIKRI